MVRVYLDNILLQDTPIGWDDAVIKSKRDNNVKSIFLEYTTDLEFYGDGFDYIDSVMNSDYCQTIDVLIESDDCDSGNFREEFRGVIQLTQITTYDVDRRIIATKILDETFDAKINNNKSLKAFVNVGTSKNGESITEVTQEEISFFLPTAQYGTYISNKRHGYRVYDCFRFIIDYMTDGFVDFRSDIFDVGGEYYNYFLFTGSEIRQGLGNGDKLEVSFKELYDELRKKFNLGFAIEPSDSYAGRFQLRLEDADFFEDTDAVLTLSNVAGIEMEFNKDELYSNVEIGSKDFDDNVVLSYPPINFKAFKEENYTILGQCNIDKALDLVSSYIIDTNIIEDILVNSTKSYDKKTFIVETDGTKAIKYKEYGTPVSIGVTSATNTNELIDTTKDFLAEGVVTGQMAVNIDTGDRAEVLSVNLAGDTITLDADIFTITGQNYRIMDAPFNYNHSLTNIEVVGRFIGGLPNSVIKHLSSSSTANFRAGLTSPTTISTFPSTINPYVFDDDTSTGFFDDGANYDTSNGYYTIPTSGLYGFESTLVYKFSGQDSVELLANGDFSSGSTDWFYPTAPEYTISGLGFSVNNQTTVSIGFLTTIAAYIQANSIYVLELDVDITYGYIELYGQQITTTGQHTIIIDTTTQNYSTKLTMDFKSINSGGLPRCVILVKSLSLKQRPKFTINHSIERRNSNNQVLQTFTDTTVINMPYGYWQYTDFTVSDEVYSTFQGEKASVKLNIINNAGQNTSVDVLTGGNGYFGRKTSDFKTISVDDGGGNILPVEPTTFPIYVYKFDKAIKYNDFLLLKNNPEKAILFSQNSTTYITGWRNNINYNRETGVAEFELRSKTKINADCEI